MTTRNRFKTGVLLSSFLGTVTVSALLCLAMLPLADPLAGSQVDGSKAAYAASTIKNPNVRIYHDVWQNVKEQFVFTERLKDWDKWEHKYDDKIKTKADAVKYAKEMVKSLKDPFTKVLDEKETTEEKEQMNGEFVGVGIKFNGARDGKGKPIETKEHEWVSMADANKYPLIFKTIPGSPAQKAGLKSGDAIVSVAGKPVKGWSTDNLVKNIKGPAGTKVTLEILRNGKVSKVPLIRRRFNIPAVYSHRLPGDIGYIELDNFISHTATAECADAIAKLGNCKGYILDLRSNPGGLVTNAQGVASLFLESGDVFKIRQRTGGYSAEANATVDPFADHSAAGKPLVILVDGGTASASEIVSGCLRDNRHVKLVGTRTYGKGLMQSISKIAPGVSLNTTMAKWTTPSGICPGIDGIDPKSIDPEKGKLEPNGFTPDVTTEIGPYFVTDSPTDNQLQKAVEVLKKEMASK